MSRPIEYGAIHGRFQPFHLGHMTYLRYALAHADRVAVGITNPWPHLTQVVEGTDMQRHLPTHNPFTLFERVEMISGAVAHLGDATARRVLIVPFDVNADPHLYDRFIPLRFTQFVAAHEAWDVEKIRRFRQAGYRVHNVPVEDDRITATAVRSAMTVRGSGWQQMVPPGIAEVVDRIGATGRLTQAANSLEEDHR